MTKRGQKKKKSFPGFAVLRSDPLFMIFERHLYEFNYETREGFINSVVRDYLQAVAEDKKVIVPSSKRAQLESAIAEDVSDMLVRKIYGCLEVLDGGLIKAKQEPEVKKMRRDIALENQNAQLSPQEIKKRIAKLVR
jgi:hypothetical protein